MDEKVLFVAPYAILAKAAKEVVSERFAEAAQKIRIVRGDLHECLAAVDQAVQEGFEVIVSRGGTANLIRKHVAIPTVSIQVTGMDVLRALRQCDAYPTKVGIAGFENIIYGCEDLAAVLRVQRDAVELPAGELGVSLVRFHGCPQGADGVLDDRVHRSSSSLK